MAKDICKYEKNWYNEIKQKVRIKMTTKLNQLFRKRIGISETAKITFNMLDFLLEKTAQTIPFENLSIINGNTCQITKENLIKKDLTKK